MMRRIVALLLGLALWTVPAWAQQQYDAGGKARTSLYGTSIVNGDTPMPPGTPGEPLSMSCVSGCAGASLPLGGGNASLAVSSVTANVAFPVSTSSFPAILLTNNGSTDLFYALGNGTVSATTSSASLPAGYEICVSAGVATDVAGITSSGTTTLRVTQLSGCPAIAAAGSGGGGSGGNVNLTQVGGSSIAIGQAAMAASLPVVIASNQSAVKVDGSAVTQPISGSVSVSNFPATQPVSGTVTANQGGAPWTVAGTGTAGTAASGVVTVQGIASMTPVKVDGSGVTQPISGTITANAGTNLNTSLLALESGGNLATVASGVLSQGSTTSGQKGHLAQGAVTTAAPTYTTGQTNPLSLTTAGALRTDSSATTQPVSGTVTANAGSGTFAVSGTVGVSGNVTVVQPTGTNLHTVCDSGCSSSTAPADESAFTAGTTPQSPVGGFFQTTATSNPLTTGQMGAFQVTANRALFTNLRSSAGTELATSGAPLRVDPTGTTTQPVSGTVTANAGTGTFTVGQATGTNLHVVCDSGCSSSTAPGDESAFTAGTTSFGLTGGFFQTTATSNALTTGQMGAFQVTANRALFTNLRNSSGTEIATSGNPLRTDPTGTTTQPVSGTVTVTQSTASSLKVDLSGTAANATAINVAGASESATGSAVPSSATYVGGNGSGNLTGLTVCDKRALIGQTASAQVITGSASKKTYICSINVVTASAQGVIVVEGTGTVCATGTNGVSAGGTTASSGWQFAANGGLAQGTGMGVIMAADNASADNVCVLQSSTGQVSGVISYTQF